MNNKTKPPKIIGTITYYTGDELPHFKGHKVFICGIFKNIENYTGEAFETYIEVDGSIQQVGPLLRTDEAIEEGGGVCPTDRVEVLPWIEEEGDFCLTSYDPLASDLLCFQQEAQGLEIEPHSGDEYRILSERAEEIIRKVKKCALELGISQKEGASSDKFLADVNEAEKMELSTNRNDNSATKQKVVSIRIPASTVDTLDEVWKRHGFRSRVDLIKKALGSYLRSIGEVEMAELL